MEQPPQPRSSPPPPPAASGGSAGPPAAPSEAGLLVCPTCNEPRQEDARYCEECGYDFGEAPPPSGTPAPPQERTRLTGPMLWLAVLFWAVLAVAGLYFLYTALYSL